MNGDTREHRNRRARTKLDKLAFKLDKVTTSEQYTRIDSDIN